MPDHSQRRSEARWRIAIIDLPAGIQRWESDHARVWVHIDENRRATGCQVFPLRRTQHGALAVVRCWLHL
jgi:hypothetical protein